MDHPKEYDWDLQDELVEEYGDELRRNGSDKYDFFDRISTFALIAIVSAALAFYWFILMIIAGKINIG